MPAAIDADQIPGKDLDPDAIETNAATIKGLAGDVRDNGSQVQLTWQRMAGVYTAPEADQLLGLMDPVSSQATASGDGIETVAGALTAFATDVRPIKAELDALRLEAQAFAAEISGGVSVRELNPAWMSSQGYQGSWNAYGAYSSSSTGGSTTSTVASEVPQYRTVTKEWHEVQDYVDRNNDLIARVNAQQVLLWEAERTCANTIRGLYCAAPLRAATGEDDALGYGIAEIPTGTEMPWGAEVERTEGCGEASMNFVFKDFLWEGIAVGGIWGTVEGLGTLVLGYDPNTGDFFSGDAYGAAWGSLGQLALGGVIAGTPPLNILFAVDDGMRQFGGDGFLPDEVADFKDGLDETALNTGKALIAWDKWADDPGTALGESVFNVGTILIPGGAAVAGVKTAGTAASVLSKMARFTDLVDPGAWAVNGAVRVGGHTFSGIGDLMARLDAPAFSGLDVVHLGDDLGQPAVLRADTGQAGVDALIDELGIDPNTITARIDDGVPVLEAPGVRVELPEGAFGDAVRAGDGAVGTGAAEAAAPVREPELVASGGARVESGPGAVDPIVDDAAPVRSETSGGESTVVRETEGTAGGHSGSEGSGSGGNGGSSFDDRSALGGSDDVPADGSGDAGAGSDGGTAQGASEVAAHTLADGSQHVVRTSHDQISAIPSAEHAITEAAARHGLTVSDLHHLIHETRPSALSRPEANILLDVRESVPMPASGELMQKVLDSGTAEKYLSGEYGARDVGGFVARAADAQKLVSPQELVDGFGLDYKGSAFIADDGSVGDVYAVRFEKTDELHLNVPDRTLANAAGQPGHYHPDGMKNHATNPYRGNGFVGDGSRALIPEYHLAQRVAAVGPGAEMWRIGPDGSEQLVGVLVDDRWLRVRN